MDNIEHGQITLLLVDDTPVNLEIASNILVNEGYEIYIADSGIAALELLDKKKIDLILLDIMMPDMDGFETYLKIQEREHTKNIPVIFLSAKVDMETIAEGFDLGGVDYLRKPFNAKELKARVKAHVDLKKTREELKDKSIKLENAYEELRVLSSFDPTTKLPNRRDTIRIIENEQIRFERNRRTFSIAITDIDFFKRINDIYGNNYGDFVLAKIADIFRNNIRKQDYIGRWGGDEFIFVFPETNIEGAVTILEKLRQAIENSSLVEGVNDTKITMTFGVAQYNTAKDINNLVFNADNALYIGKAQGGNCIVIGE